MHRKLKFKENHLFIKTENSSKTKFQNFFKSLLFYFFRLLPIDDKKIVFQCFKGMGYLDSPKYIHKQIVKENLDLKCVWITKQQFTKQFPESIKLVPYNTIRSIYELATAKIWIDNCRKESNVRKRKGQYYLETWHNGISLKRVEKSVESKLTKEYIRSAKNDSLIVDIFISNSVFSTKRYKKDFWYDGKIVESGLPRNDIFFINEKEKLELRKKVTSYFHLDNDTKLLLYAPTFRKDFNTDVYLNDLTPITSVLEKRFCGNWISLVHLHPNLSNKASQLKYNENYIDTSGYPDFQELLMACDVLLTDYSSTMFEFSFELKPVFLFMSDLDDYKNDRDFEIDLKELPYPISYNIKELKNNIMKFNKEKYENQLVLFLKKIGIKECGYASKTIVDILKGELRL